MNTIIREARLEDSSAIAIILRALGWSEQIKRESLADTQAQIASYLERCQREKTHTILVAEREQEQNMRKVSGYIAVHWYPHLMRGNDGYVSELFVHPDATGHGIGSLLLDTIKATALERNCTRLLLMNGRTRESYTRQFYAKRGWVELRDAAFFSLT
ncbi:MAG: GNAT family N-acetyltransferase, partial [Ktedonobacteraceae bacterium]|nr:GNAT family N-acetyltransferase [Ktedonobacteraceae bacterium]